MIKIITALLCGILLVSPAYAQEAGEFSEIVSETETEMETVQEITQNIEYKLELESPLGVYILPEDDYNAPIVSTFAVGGDVYAGSYNTSIVQIWEGILSNNVGKDYVGFRSSQYEYYFFYGDDFSYESGTFSGSGSFVYLNTYGNAYNYTTGEDSFNVRVGEGYVFTNISQDFPALSNERGMIYEKNAVFALFSLFIFMCMRWVLLRK